MNKQRRHSTISSFTCASRGKHKENSFESLKKVQLKSNIGFIILICINITRKFLPTAQVATTAFIQKEMKLKRKSP